MKKKGRNDKNELLGILKNPTFIIFDITHLFIKDYVQKGLGETNQILLLSYYSIASGFGPSIGGSIGGSIVTYVGGYEHKNSCKVIFIFSICILITTYFLCYTDSLFTTILISTVCGNFPGPLYYEIINDKFKDTNPRLAWRCSIFYYIVGFTLLQFACYFRYQDLKKKEEENKKKDEEEEMKVIDNK